MAGTLQLKVVTPAGSLLDEEVASFTARSEMGEFCILPEHRAILASLAAGRMVVEQPGGGKHLYALDCGFLEAGGDHVNVITERCVPARSLDKERVDKELAEAEAAIAGQDLTTPEAAPLLRALDWARTQLDVLEHPLN